MKVPLNAARAARNAVCAHYTLHRDLGGEGNNADYTDAEKPGEGHHTPWCPKLVVGSHEELSDDQWIVSWEEGVDYEWVYDEAVREEMEKALVEYRDTVPAFKRDGYWTVNFRVEAVNHWCVAIFADMDMKARIVRVS